MAKTTRKAGKDAKSRTAAASKASRGRPARNGPKAPAKRAVRAVRPKPSRPQPSAAKRSPKPPRAARASVTISERRPASSPKMFVNLPVRDLKRSMEFFQKLGYTFNPKFSNDDGACMVVSEHNYAMLLSHKFFSTFTPKAIADAKTTVEVLVALSCDDRKGVDDIVRKALANGATEYRKPQDLGFMYSWGFEDPDGHIWEHFWMDPAAVENPPQVDKAAN